MKNLCLAIALMLLFGSLASGQKMTAEQSLMKMEQEMADAMLRGDSSVWDKYSVDNAVFTDPGGMLMTKAQAIGMFKSGDLKIESSKMHDMKVQMFGDTALVTYLTTDKGTYKGKDISGEYRWTDVFVKIAGKWKMIGGQGTPVMKM